MKNIILILSLLILLVFACTDQNYSIYYFLESETKEVDSTLDNHVSVAAMADYDTGSLYYIAAGGTIRYRDSEDSSDSWKALDLPSEADICTALAIVNNTTLYAGFLMENGNFALYSTANFGTKSPTWTLINNAAVLDKEIIRLKSIGPNLYIFTRDPDSTTPYQLYDQTFTEAGTGAQKTAYVDVFEGTSPALWAAIAGNNAENIDSVLVSGANLAGLAAMATWSSTKTYQIGGLFIIDGADEVYVSTRNGYVYYSADDGATWSLSDKKKVIDNEVRFGRINQVNGSLLVIGSYNYGMYTMDPSDLNSLSRISDFTSDELYNGMIWDIFIDPNSTSRIFALTIGAGLWRNAYTGSWDSDNWNHE